MAPNPENSQNPASPEDRESSQYINAMEEEPQESASPNTVSPEQPQNAENSEDINAIEYMEEEGAEPEEPPEEPESSTDQGCAENSEVRNARMLHGTRRTSTMKPTRPRPRSSVTKLSRATQTNYMRQQITGQLRAMLRNNPTGHEIARLAQSSFRALSWFWLQVWNILWKR